MIHKAVILAAGKGTRMGALTSEIPKQMLPVGGRPVLEHIISNLKMSGVDDLLVITGYRAEAVEAHFGNGSDWDCSIRYRRQETQDGTGKVVELGREFVADDPFLLVYGDILVEQPTYAALIRRFDETGASGVLTIKLGEDITKGGALLFDEAFRLTELVEKPSAEELAGLRSRPGFKPWYNAGLYAFSPELFPHLARLEKSVRGEYELTDAIRSLARDTGRVFGMEIEGYWIDVRDPELLAKAQRLVS